MTPLSIPAQLDSADDTLVLVEHLIAQERATRRSFRALTTLDVRTLDHPAAESLQRFYRGLTAVGAALWRGDTAKVTPFGLTKWARLRQQAWEDLLLEVPETVATGMEAISPARPSDVARVLDAVDHTATGFFHQPTRWRPRVLPEAADVEALLGTLSPSILRQVGDWTTRATGSATVIRRACAAVLTSPAQLAHHAWSGTGGSHLLLQLLVARGGRLPLAELPLRFGHPLQHASRSIGSHLAWLQRLGLVYAGIHPQTGVLEVVVPDSVATVVTDLYPPPKPGRHGRELEVVLTGIEPPIRRRIRLQGDASLADLHFAIQDAFGWENRHLFEFTVPADPRTPVGGMPDDSGFGTPTPDARGVPLADYLHKVGDQLLYVYDFGDHWEHLVILTDVLPRPLRHRRILVDGSRAAPVEDSGGVPGYNECVDVALGRLEDPDRTAWLQGWHPEDFDLERARAAFNI